MKTKYRYPLVLFLASFILIIGGIGFKVMHWRGSTIVFGAGMLVQMFSILWLIVVILKPVKLDK